MRALLDINVLLDFLLTRKRHEEAGIVLDHARGRRFKAYVSAHEITTLSYFLEKDPKFRGSYREKISLLLMMTEILPVDRPALESALTSEISDFEDAVLEAVAAQEKLDCIVTHNTADFTRSRILALTPASFLKRMISEENGMTVREPVPSYRSRPRRRAKAKTA